mmetsp:Transcript_24410/g.39067  ORF Transcript_24410/g.39067 Transcript_24410/m.39067 type:complete len:210 (+) Transcript_24410:285-914(+)
MITAITEIRITTILSNFGIVWIPTISLIELTPRRHNRFWADAHIGHIYIVATLWQVFHFRIIQSCEIESFVELRRGCACVAICMLSVPPIRARCTRNSASEHSVDSRPVSNHHASSGAALTRWGTICPLCLPYCFRSAPVLPRIFLALALRFLKRASLRNRKALRTCTSHQSTFSYRTSTMYGTSEDDLDVEKDQMAEAFHRSTNPTKK